MIGVNLDVWSLLRSLNCLLLIPLILIALLISKLIPVYLLKRWYDTKTVFASGFLLTSTLSLVIAAATIGEKMGVITKGNEWNVYFSSGYYLCVYPNRL